MEKLTLTRVKRTQRTSSKTGRPFTSLGIQCKEYGDKWLSGFDGKETQDWVEGSVVEVEIEKKGDYVNFSVPKSSHQKFDGGITKDDIALINRKLDAIFTEQKMIRGILADAGMKKVERNSDGSPVPFQDMDEPKDGDLPW